MTHICVSELPIIGSDNGLSPGRRQAIIWTNAGILLIRTWGRNFSEILSEICAFSFKKMHLKMSAKWRPFCLGLNVLTQWQVNYTCHVHQHNQPPWQGFFHGADCTNVFTIAVGWQLTTVCKKHISDEKLHACILTETNTHYRLVVI